MNQLDCRRNAHFSIIRNAAHADFLATQQAFKVLQGMKVEKYLNRTRNCKHPPQCRIERFRRRWHLDYKKPFMYDIVYPCCLNTLLNLLDTQTTFCNSAIWPTRCVTPGGPVPTQTSYSVLPSVLEKRFTAVVFTSRPEIRRSLFQQHCERGCCRTSLDANPSD